MKQLRYALEQFKWNNALSEEWECTVKERVFKGRMTPSRYKVLLSWVNERNAQDEVRFPNGSYYDHAGMQHGYTCGCIHDCCGHLYQHGFDIIREKHVVYGTVVTVRYTAHYNF